MTLSRTPRVFHTGRLPTIWSIGHGTRPIEDFLALLREAGIATLADVRSFPGSRRHPQFGKEAVRASLAQAGIAYVHLPGLGGRRPEGDLDGDDLARLTVLARHAPTAFMCAETLWRRCHRRTIADRLTADGWEVVHVLGPGKSDTHALSA